MPLLPWRHRKRPKERSQLYNLLSKHQLNSWLRSKSTLWVFSQMCNSIMYLQLHRTRVQFRSPFYNFRKRVRSGWKRGRYRYGKFTYSLKYRCTGPRNTGSPKLSPARSPGITRSATTRGPRRAGCGRGWRLQIRCPFVTHGYGGPDSPQAMKIA